MAHWTTDASGCDVWVPTSFTGKLVGTIIVSFVVGIVTFGAYNMIGDELFKNNADAQVAFTLGMDGNDAVLTDVRVEHGDYYVAGQQCVRTGCTIHLDSFDLKRDFSLVLDVRPSACAPCVDASVWAGEGRTVEMRSFSGYEDKRFRGRYFLKLGDPDSGAIATLPKATTVACR